MSIKGRILNIKRFEIHDGDGLRTTLFLKGCPLRCQWCHNPESRDVPPELGYYAHKCINCGECVKACPNGAHSISDKGHIYNREKCVACGKCEEACLGGALVFYGKSVTPEEILPKLLEDKMFYDNSDGGVTVSGGEPLMQADFTAKLLELLHKSGVNTAVDSCLFANRSELDKVIPYTDTFLADIKAIDEQVHKKCTGVSNKIILDNILYLDSLDKKMEIRIPYVPTMNSEEIGKIGEFLKPLHNIKAVKVLAYHNLSTTKYESIGLTYELSEQRQPTDEEINRAVKTLKSFGLVAIR